MNPRDIAIGFEAIKIAWRQSKDGFVLTLSIHPDDVNVDLANSRIGTRYQVALVEIADTGEPVAGKEMSEGAHAVAVAAALCRNERFWQWLASSEGLFIDNEAEAAEWLREELGIASRADLKTNQDAREKFNGIRERFLDDYRRSR